MKTISKQWLPSFRGATLLTGAILLPVILTAIILPARAEPPADQPFLLGADYPNKPSDADKSLFYETGMNCIRLAGGGYAWETDDHEKLAAEFQARGLGVYAQLASHYPSADYFGAKDTWFVDQDGKTGVEDRKAWAISYDGNNWPQLSYAAADEYFPKMERDFTQYMSHLADDHNIRGIILHNEPGLFWMTNRIFDYNPQSITQFRDWLRDQHTDIATLNARWGTSFASFDVVDPPRQLPPYQNVAAWMDWRRFQVEVIARFMRREAEFSAKLRPDIPRTTNLPGPIDNWYGYRLSDIAAYSQPMDVVGIDIYPAKWTDRVFIPFAIAMARGAAQDRPAHVLECDVFSDKLWKGMSESDRAGMLRGELWTMIGHGARAIFMWGFHHDDEYSLTDGSFNDRLRVCRDIAHATRMIDIDHFTAPRAKVALCVDPDDFIYTSGTEKKPLTTSSQLSAQIHGIYAAIADSHVPVEIIETPRLDLALGGQYSALVLANASMMDAHCAQQLETFVRGGGTLVGVGSLAQRDRWGIAQGIVPGFRLDHLFGVVGTSVDPAAPHWANQQYKPRAAQVIAPGFTCNTLGTGKAFLIANDAQKASMDSGDREQFAKELVAAVSIPPSVTSSQSPGADPVDVSTLNDGAGDMLVIASTLGSDGKLPLPVNDVQLTINNSPDFRAAYVFPPTAISNGIIHSGPRKISGLLNQAPLDIGPLDSSLPILLVHQFAPLLAIEGPMQAKAGDDATISVTCFNSSSNELKGNLSLQLPAGLADVAPAHPISVPAFGEQTIQCTVNISKDHAKSRAVINAQLTGPTIVEVTGLPVDLNVQ